MQIKTLLTSVISLLVALLVVSTVVPGLEALGQRRAAERFAEINRVAEQLLTAGGQWAVERGTTNGLLGSADAVPPERRQAVAERRSKGDAAFRAALESLRAMPE